MDFQKVEIVFFTAVSVFGILGGVIRLCRDNVSYGIIGNVGRCLSSGLVAFGVTGIWIGHDSSGLAGPFYYLASASLIGYASHDLQEKIFNKAVGKIMEKLGLSDTKQGE